MLPKFWQNLSLQEAFEIKAQINEDLKGTEFEGAFRKKFKLLIDCFCSFFRLTQKISRENDPSIEN